MSAISFFMVHDGPGPVRAVHLSEEFQLLSANYQVPILWLSLFSQDDLRRIALPLDEYGDGSTPETMPVMFARTTDALSRYAARKDALRLALDPQHHEQIDEWERFLETHMTLAYVQLDVEDFFGASDDFDAELAAWLDGVAQMKGDGWAHLCEVAVLDDPDVAHFGMRGSPHAAQLDWRE